MKSEDVWSYRLRAAKIPFFIIGGFYLISLIVGLLSFSLYESIFMNSLLVYVVIIGGFTIGAHVSLVDHKIPRNRVIQGGVLAGLGVGLISALVSIILLKNTALMALSVDMALAASAGSPVDAGLLETTIMLGSYLGIVISPIFNGGIGALFSWIAVLLTAKFYPASNPKNKTSKKN